MGQVSEPLDPAQGGVGAGLDDQHAATAALDDEAQVARAAQGFGGTDRGAANGKETGQQT